MRLFKNILAAKTLIDMEEMAGVLQDGQNLLVYRDDTNGIVTFSNAMPELPAAGALAGTDILWGLQGETAVSMSLSSLADFLTTLNEGTFAELTVSETLTGADATFSGNVGMGTLSPATALDIGGGSNFTNSSGTYQFYSDDAKILQVVDSSQAALNLVSGINTNNGVLGALAFSRSLGQSDAHVNVAGIQALQKGTGTAAGGQLQFWTKQSGYGTSSPDLVLYAGNVGIGTTSPSNTLDVNGTIGVSGTLTGAASNWSGTSTYTGSAAAAFTSGSNGYFYGQNVASNLFVMNSVGSNYGFISNVSSDLWALGYGTSTTTLGTSALTWDSSGAINIPGIITAGADMSVAGDATVTGDFTVSGQIFANATFASYTGDGVWDGDARPSTITTPNGSGRGFYFGYSDAGSGQYVPSLGFGIHSDNFNGDLWILQSRVALGSSESYNRWGVTADGHIWWGPGSSATELRLYRETDSVLRTNGSFTIEGKLNTSASTFERAGLNIPAGTSPDVYSHEDGDIWQDGTNLYVVISGTAYTFNLTPV